LSYTKSRESENGGKSHGCLVYLLGGTASSSLEEREILTASEMSRRELEKKSTDYLQKVSEGKRKNETNSEEPA